MNLKKGTVVVDGTKYKLNDTNFPTLDPDDPYRLTREEEEVMERLCESFKHSLKLNEHIKFIYQKGELYTIFNSNLLFHACIPMEENGDFKEVEFLGQKVKGKEYLDLINETIKKVYFDVENREYLVDIMWYLWISPDSPFFGKDKMATFESYFIDEKEAHKEEKNPYYYLSGEEEICDKILNEFGLKDDVDAHIVNGHIPVKAKDRRKSNTCKWKVISD